MNLTLQIQPYVLPLVDPWPTRQGNPITQRRGSIVGIRSEQQHGYGDCPPFPSAGTETFDSASLLLQQIHCQTWSNGQSLLDELAQYQPTHPSVYYAVETAWLDLLGKLRQQPMHQLIGESGSAKIAVNALCGSLCTENTRKAQQQGFSVLKLKAGVDNLQEEIHCLKKICQHLPPKVQLRIDANGAWSMKAARFFLHSVEKLPIESIEEPLQNPGLKQISQLQTETPHTLALDESLIKFKLADVLSTPHIRRLVLKPAVQGGLLKCFSISERAAQNNIDCVITTVVDSAVGVQASTHLAAAVDNICPRLAHGLATSNWLSKNLATPPEIKAGYITLSNHYGLGIDDLF